MRTRDAQHVSVRNKNHVRPGRDRDGLVDQFQRGDAHRAARPVDQLDLRREHLVQAVLDDGMRLATADFHNHPGSGHKGMNLVQNTSHQCYVPILVEIFHSLIALNCARLTFD